MFEKWRKSKKALSEPVPEDTPEEIPQGVHRGLSDNIVALRELFGESFDLVIKETTVNGIGAAFSVLDGMYDNLLTARAVIQPVLETKLAAADPRTLYEHIMAYRVSECDSKEALTLDMAAKYLIEGNVLLFVDGVPRCLAFSVQGYPKKSIDKPESEVQEQGSHEGFGDMYKDNVTLVRRRIKSPDVRFETLTAGATGNTTLCVCYHAKRADPHVVNQVKEKLKNMKIDIIPGSGAVRPFLEGKGMSLFTSVGTTERPDVFAAKIAEGRVGVIVDGTPYALVVPHLFIEYFHSLDDYLNRPYYAFVVRALKIICFFAAVFLPGVYVAVGTFHQEIFPAAVIEDIVAALGKTPFPLVVEALVIHFIYEIVREAGLRMPQAIGHAVNIVGALVIGDAAVTAGLISAPMLIIVAVTAICSAVVSPLQQPAAVLRLIFIIVGSLMGLYGIMMGFALITVNICAVNSFGVPYTAPFSPFDLYATRDALIFAGWRKIGRRAIRIQKLKGSDYDAGEG